MSVGCTYVVVSVYFVIFIKSFVENGHLESDEDAKTIFSKMMLAIFVSVFFTLPLIGWISDKPKAYLLIPISSFLLACTQIILGYT
jgi:fucose permease